MSNEVGFPTVLPGGYLLPHMSARLRTQIMDTLFQITGGVERAQAWIEKSDENYGEFFKMWAKGQARQTAVEHNVGPSVEQMIDRLDERDRKKQELMIDVTPTAVAA